MVVSKITLSVLLPPIIYQDLLVQKLSNPKEHLATLIENY